MVEELDEKTIRQYLLGEMAEAEMSLFEERLMTDDDLFESLLVIEDDLIDERAADELSAEEQARFDAYFLATPPRRERLQLAYALHDYAAAPKPVDIPDSGTKSEPASATPPENANEPAVVDFPSLPQKLRPVRRYLTLAAAAVILIAVGLGTWQLLRPSDVSNGLQALNDAYRNESPVDARITALNYPPRSTTRGGDAGDKVDTVERDLADSLLLRAVKEHPGIDSFHALGRLYLTKREFEQAIIWFDKALALDDKNAQLHSDLGAALFEKGRSASVRDEDGRSAEAFAQSLEHLNRALAIDPNLREALFNRALLHQQMMLLDRAAEDWRAYLEKDSTSPWADEAREHLDQIEERQRRTEQSQQKLVEEFLTACKAVDSEKAWTLLSSNREKLTTELLATYLDSAGQQPTTADRTRLNALVFAGGIDIKRAGDHYAADLARFYQSASPQQLLAAAEARESLRRANELYLQSQLDHTADLYARAQRILLQIGNRCEARVSAYKLGLVYLEKAKVDQSAAVFASLARDCEADGYRWLQARALFYKSGVEFNRNEYSQAIASAKHARTEAEKINDQPCAFAASSALIEYYRLLDNQRECFREIALSLPLLKTAAFGPMALGRHYGIVAMSFNTFGLYNAALDYQQEALRFANEMDDFFSLSVAHAHLGLMYGKLQNFAEAFKHLDLAYAQAAGHANERVGQEKMAYALLQTGNLYRETGDSANALASYKRSVELYQALDFPTHLYQAYKGRLVSYIAQNDVTAAQQQLTDILALMERHRENIFEEENRNDFFDVEQSVYDLGIDLAYARLGNGQKAFEYAEESRARSLLDSISAGAPSGNHDEHLDSRPPAGIRPFSVAQIKARIPAGARLLQYAVLDDKLLIWIVSPDGLPQPVASKVSQATLKDKVSSYLTSLKGSSEADVKEASRLARELYGDLIAPVEPLLGGSHILYIVPDKMLYRLPWDALVSPATGRYVIEDYLVLLAPSATLFAMCTDLANQKTDGRTERGMIVGNPSFDHDAFPKLDALSDAVDEAKEIARLYPSRSLLLGPAAREQAVRDELARADVGHFALHCVINERSPMRSSLLLTKEPASSAGTSPTDGQLQAQEITVMNLPRLRLAVLSACQTGVERYYQGEGMIGMARAFLIARVPLVVASLWPVDTKATAKLMVRFHEYRKRNGLPTAEALQQAKRSLLQENAGRYRQPYYWAAFQTIGGQANF